MKEKEKPEQRQETIISRSPPSGGGYAARPAGGVQIRENLATRASNGEKDSLLERNRVDLTLGSGKGKEVISGDDPEGEGGWNKVTKRGNRGGQPQSMRFQGQYPVNRGYNAGFQKKQGLPHSQPARDRETTFNRQASGDGPLVGRGLAANRLGRNLGPQKLQPGGGAETTTFREPIAWTSVEANVASSSKGKPIPKITPISILGDKAAQMRQEDIDELSNYWKQTLVIFVMGGSPPYMSMRRFIDLVWKPAGKTELISKSNGFYFCRFEDMEDLERVLAEGPWLYSGRYMAVKQWEENVELEKYVLSTMPVWIRLPNLPMELWHSYSLGSIATLIGNPIRMDEMTEQRKRLDFARLFIEISAEKGAPKEVLIAMPSGNVFKQPVIYEYLPPRCTGCISLGHTISSCPNKGSSFLKQIPSSQEAVDKANDSIDMEVSTRQDSVHQEENAEKQDGGQKEVNNEKGNTDVENQKEDSSDIMETQQDMAVQQRADTEMQACQEEVVQGCLERSQRNSAQDQVSLQQTSISQDVNSKVLSQPANVSNEKVILSEVQKDTGQEIGEASQPHNSKPQDILMVDKEVHNSLLTCNKQPDQEEHRRNEATNQMQMSSLPQQGGQVSNEADDGSADTLVVINPSWTWKLGEATKEGNTRISYDNIEYKSRRDVPRHGKKIYHPYK